MNKLFKYFKIILSKLPIYFKFLFNKNYVTNIQFFIIKYSTKLNCTIFLLYIYKKFYFSSLIILFMLYNIENYAIVKFFLYQQYCKIIYKIHTMKWFMTYFSWKYSFSLIYFEHSMYVKIPNILMTIGLLCYNFSTVIDVFYLTLNFISETNHEIITIIKDVFDIFHFIIVNYINTMKLSIYIYNKFKIFKFRRRNELNYLIGLYNFYVYFYLNIIFHSLKEFNIFIYRVYIKKYSYMPSFFIYNKYYFKSLQIINRILYSMTHYTKINLYKYWYNKVSVILNTVSFINRYNILAAPYKNLREIIKKIL